MKILITGGSGFVGRSLALEAAKKPGAEVFTPSHAEMDIRDSEQTLEVVEKFKPTHIFHLAGDLRRGREESLYNELFKTNTEGTLNLLSAASKVGVEAFVYMGTLEEYGNAPAPYREDGPIYPVSPYGVTKAAASQLTASYGMGVIPAVALRYPAIFGPGQKPETLMSKLKEAFDTGQPMPLPPGEQTRDFLYIDDAVGALLAAAENIAKCSGEIINICRGEERTVKEIVGLIEKVTGRNDFAKLGALPYRPNEQMRAVGSNEKMKKLLNFEPQVSLEEGIRRTFLK